MPKEYASPTHKLLNVFKEGRDKWKEKTIRVKKEIKLCKNRIIFLETSKEKFKNRAKELEALVTEMKAEISDLKSRLNNNTQESNGSKKKK
jgi:predicted RNase H-like nuclease (RuvC/YqgF family)